MRTWQRRLGGALAAVAVLAAVAHAKGRDRRPAVYSVAGAAVTLPESGLGPRDAESKAMTFGPNISQVMHLDTVTWESDDVYYTLSVATLPSVLRPVPPVTLRAGARKGLVEPSGQGALLDVEDHKLVPTEAGPADCTALNIRVGKNRVRARIVAHEGRVVQLTAVGSHSSVDRPVVTAALDSLTLTATSP